MKSVYEDKFVDKIAYSYLLFVTVFFSIYTFAKPLVDKYTNDILLKIISLFGMMCVMYFSLNRDFYLPFLGDTVFPTGLLGDNIFPNTSDLTVSVKLKSNTKIIYWAAEPCEDTQSCNKPIMAWDAYKNYGNAGITTSNKEGMATIKIRSPQFYKVPFKSEKLSPHIHYREILADGMLSKIKTYKVY
jgi:hypothetical protein